MVVVVLVPIAFLVTSHYDPCCEEAACIWLGGLLGIAGDCATIRINCKARLLLIFISYHATAREAGH